MPLGEGFLSFKSPTISLSLTVLPRFAQPHSVSLLLGARGHSTLSEASLSPEMEGKLSGNHAHLLLGFTDSCEDWTWT